MNVQPTAWNFGHRDGSFEQRGAESYHAAKVGVLGPFGCRLDADPANGCAQMNGIEPIAAD
jgi:hypothetical protein